MRYDGGSVVHVLIAIFLPYICTGVAKVSGGYGLSDNHDPQGFS
jgi:uncharacterized MAPEG superfamily protein